MENGGVPQSATPETCLKEAIHVISCGYEDKTQWGSEVLLITLITTCTLLFNFNKSPCGGNRSVYLRHNQIIHFLLMYRLWFKFSQEIQLYPLTSTISAQIR